MDTFLIARIGNWDILLVRIENDFSVSISIVLYIASNKIVDTIPGWFIILSFSDRRLSEKEFHCYDSLGYKYSLKSYNNPPNFFDISFQTRAQTHWIEFY